MRVFIQLSFGSAAFCHIPQTWMHFSSAHLLLPRWGGRSEAICSLVIPQRNWLSALALPPKFPITSLLELPAREHPFLAITDLSREAGDVVSGPFCLQPARTSAAVFLRKIFCSCNEIKKVTGLDIRAYSACLCTGGEDDPACLGTWWTKSPVSARSCPCPLNNKDLYAKAVLRKTKVNGSWIS